PLLPALPEAAPLWRSARAPKGALTADRAWPVAVPPCETVSEEAATPGVTRNACTFWEPLRRPILLILLRVRPWGTTRNRLSGKPPQNQPGAITGSVSSTPAVIALSPGAQFSSTANCGAPVRNLWRMGLACGW